MSGGAGWSATSRSSPSRAGLPEPTGSLPQINNHENIVVGRSAADLAEKPLGNTSIGERILRRTKYIGCWVWNRTGSRRDPRTVRRRVYTKPESEHLVFEDETLRIFPQALWDAVQAQLKDVAKVWPGGQRRGFSDGQRSRSEVYPTYLFDGMLRCASCKLTGRACHRPARWLLRLSGRCAATFATTA